MLLGLTPVRINTYSAVRIVIITVLLTVYFLPHNDLTVDGFSFSALKTRQTRHKRPTRPSTAITKLVRKSYWTTYERRERQKCCYVTNEHEPAAVNSSSEPAAVNQLTLETPYT